MLSCCLSGTNRTVHWHHCLANKCRLACGRVLPPEVSIVSPSYLAIDSTSFKCAANVFSQTDWADWAGFWWEWQCRGSSIDTGLYAYT